MSNVSGNKPINEEKNLEFQESTKFGALREISAIRHFIEQGFTVSIPNMSVRYDFIAEKYPIFLRVQVKNLIPKKKKTDHPSSQAVWCIRAYSTVFGKRRPYSIADCDVVVAISLETEDFAIVPISEVEGRSSEYRLSKHDDSKGKAYLNSYAAIEEIIFSYAKSIRI